MSKDLTPEATDHVTASRVLAGDLVEGHYQVVAEAEGDQLLELSLPFPVTLAPSALLAGYHG
jgi:hypothetical protein